MLTAEDDTAIKSFIMEYVKVHKMTTVGTIARLLKRKSETIEPRFKFLIKRGLLYDYGVESGQHYYGIAPMGCHIHKKKSEPDTSEKVEESGTEGGESGIESVPYGRIWNESTRATTESEVRYEAGFVCHPITRRQDVGIEFLRTHWNGSVTVEVTEQGTVAGRYAWKDTDATISFNNHGMSGNTSVDAKVSLPYDPDVFSVNALACKDGTIKNVRVYIHERYIYYQQSEKTAKSEFINQVHDVLSIMERLGWRFGNIRLNMRNLHRAINSQELGNIPPASYRDHDTDMVHFDRSHGVAEAEVYGATQDANETVEFLCNPMERINQMSEGINAIGEGMITLGKTIGAMSDVLTKLMVIVTQQSEIMVKVVENSTTSQYTAPPSDNGSAYGRI